MSLARQHRDRIAAANLAKHALAHGSTGGLATFGEEAVPAANTAAAQIQLRLTHDLRRLKDIKSIEAKVKAKRVMLPEYRAWCDGLLQAARDSGQGVEDAVLPTIMVWCIDTGDWSRALELAAHVLTHDLPLPARYQRDASSLVVEEIATAAIKMQAAGEAFPLQVLEDVDRLVIGADMHDEIRAKLMKAIGTEYERAANAATGDAIETNTVAALTSLRRAQELHDRAGVTTAIRRLEKAVAVARRAVPPADPVDNPETT